MQLIAQNICYLSLAFKENIKAIEAIVELLREVI